MHGLAVPLKISALLVMSPERRSALLERLEACGIEVLPVSNCEEARRILRERPPLHVVLTDEALPDGTWSSVLQEVWGNEVPAATIVCTRVGDPGLWLHVLARGVYDLLVAPYDNREVRRIIEGAAAESRMCWDSSPVDSPETRSDRNPPCCSNRPPQAMTRFAGTMESMGEETC